VFAGLTLVNRVWAGTFMAITISSALIASLAIDQFGWFRMEMHAVSPLKPGGAVLLIIGVICITRK
jgi:bacterial/archaeal transporter family-2 protein